MASVHGLQHVQGLAAAALPHHNSIGAHTQRISNKVTNGDLALAFLICLSGFKRNNVLTLKVQLRCIFNAYNAFGFGICMASARSNVVLPEPVPPETTTLRHDSTASTR